MPMNSTGSKVPSRPASTKSNMAVKVVWTADAVWYICVGGEVESRKASPYKCYYLSTT